MRLHEAVDLFIRDYPNQHTQRAYEGVLTPMLRMFGPDRNVTRVCPVELLEYSHYLHSDERGLSPASIHKHIKTIKTFFRWMHRLELIPTNPAQNLRQKRLPKAVEKSKAMTDAELEKLLDYFKYHPRSYAIALFLADTGCRAGGVANLKIQDLDLDHCRAVVLEKGNKKRPVVFGEPSRAAMAAWLLQRPRCDDCDYVFVHDGLPLSAAAISQIIRRGCIRVGIRSLGSHSLRHRKGHQLADAGVAPTVAATALGHSDPTITLQFYYPHDWDRAEQAMRCLVEHDPASEKITRLQRSQN